MPTSAPRALGRVVVAVLVTAAGAVAAFVAAFVAGVEWSGCFIGCSGSPDPLTGFVLSLLAGALLACGPLLTAHLFRSRAWLIVALLVGTLGSLVSASWASSM